MSKVRMLFCLFLAVTFCAAVPAAFAGEPQVVVGGRWATPDNARPTDAGETVYRCATDQPRGRPVDVPDMATVERWIQDNRISAGGVIPVNFHVIYAGSEGNLTDAQLDAQIAVMNNNFAGKDYNGNPVPGAKNTGYTFFRASVTRNNSRKWFKMTPGSGAETQAKNTLAVNWTSSLNLYTCKPGQNLLGWATFPVDLAANGKRDGVVIHYGSLPGGYLSPYNLGGTATHEVGHWVGLYHTFQGGCHSDATCSTQGDLVCDTPAEGTATSGCPGGKDTCAGTGLDPIHNYMDYSTDVCYNNFTTGQDARADVQMSTYRPLIGSARLAISDENRVTTPDGEALRCATDRPRGRPVDVPDMATVERWIQENRISAGGVIPVNFHVIHTASEGNLTDAQLDAQIAVMNNNFAGKDYNGNPVAGAKNTGYTFFRASVTRSRNNKWFRMTPGSGAETQAKNTLAVNWTSSLNLYTCKPGQNLLGWATFPVDLAANGKRDGVVIHYGSLPGGYLSPYNLGGTATHEVGHWVGLYHTFQGGCDTGSCSATGDLVCDTPAEASPTSGCPGGKDTCPATGLDPIHNYMDYSTDICYDNFTTGQDARADVQMSTYRPLIGSARLANGAGAIQSARELGGGLVEFKATPNPFNPRTKIEFGLRSAGHASIRIFDVRGRLVRTVADREFPAGNQSVDFDGHGMASGIYLMALSIRGEDTMVRRITLMK